MSTLPYSRPGRTVLVTLRTIVATAAVAGFASTDLAAQQALGIPFIGKNHLSFYSAEMNRMDPVDASTSIYGAMYGRGFGASTSPTRLTTLVRGSGRSLGDVNAGVVDFEGSLAITHDMVAIEGLSFALATGLGATVWGEDADDTGRIGSRIPVTLGAGYDLRVRSATFTPFVAPSLTYYHDRRYVEEVRVASATGWDGQVAAGVSVRFKEAVLSTSRVYGEHGVEQRSRWTFSAGMSF